MKKFISVTLVLIIVVLQISLLASCKKENEIQKFTAHYFDYFDTVTTIVGCTETKEEFDAVCEKIKTELEEYHKLYDIYYTYEGINNICVINSVKNGKHNIVKADEKIIDLLLYAKDMYELTNGKMNIAMGSVLSIWHRYRAFAEDNPQNAQLPTLEELQDASKHTDFSKVIINEDKSTVFLSDDKMKLDVGAIAKGYAVEKVAKSLEEQGITSFLLNVGGNVRTIGYSLNQEEWKIGIENPDKTNDDLPHIEYLKISDKSLVTSGSYQRFYVVKGNSYHHIIDPITLFPGKNYLSVSVLTDDSGLADALSTSLFLMDYNEGQKLVESLENVEAMWVFPDNTKKYSKNFKSYTYNPK